MKILIAYDGSDASEAALDDLPRAGLSDRAEALVVVTDIWLASSPDEFSRALARRRRLAAGMSSFAPASREVEEERALSREAKRRLRILFPAWDVRAEGAEGAGGAASTLLRRASYWGADLLVVGSCHRPARDRIVGDAALTVAAEAHCSVRVAKPAAATRGDAVRLLLAGDGPPGSTGAYRALASREWPPGSECRVITRARPGRDDETETLRAAGLRVSTAVLGGDLRDALIDEAGRWGADCIYFGTHAGGVEPRQHGPGSLVSELVASSPCSVEVVRSPVRTTAGAAVMNARATDRIAAYAG